MKLSFDLKLPIFSFIHANKLKKCNNRNCRNILYTGPSLNHFAFSFNRLQNCNCSDNEDFMKCY